MHKQPLLIQDAYDFGPPPPESRETLREKLYRFFFGDDVFISYSRADAIRYAPSLAARLATKRHICFFDQLAGAPSEELPERLKKKILRSTVFVLIGTRGAVASSFVRKEVELFRRTRRSFIPVDVDGALVEQEGWRDVVGVAKIREEGSHVRDGDPSPEVVNLIKDSFRYTRRSQWLRASLLAGVSVIFITAAASLLVIRAAQAEAVAIKRQADSEVAAANRKVGGAEQGLKNISAEANRLKGEAVDARNAADKAAEAAEAAAAQQELAEHSMRQAQELERQSAERAAESSWQEAGARATLLSRAPGMETDALTLALGAAEQSFSRQGRLPEQLLTGLAVSAAAADYSLPLDDVASYPYPLIQVSPNGEKVFAVFRDLHTNSDRQVLWDVRTGRHTDIKPKINMGLPASFSRDGGRLAVATVFSSTGEVGLYVWDLTGPEPKLLETGCGRGRVIRQVALDRDGSHAALFERPQADKLIFTLCEIATGREEVLMDISYPIAIEGFDASVDRGLAFTADDEPALYGVTRRRSDYSVQSKAIYFPRTSRVVTLKTPGSYESERLIGFGDDGSILILKKDSTPISGSKIPDCVYIQSPDGTLRKLSGYRGDILSASFSGGRARVATISGGGMRLADVHYSPSFAVLRGHLNRLNSVAFSPDGETVLTVGGDEDETARLWDVRTGRLRHTLALSNESPDDGQSGSSPSINYAAFLPDGSRLVTVNREGALQIWDVETGRPACPGLGTVLGGMPGAVSFVAAGDYVMASNRLESNERNLVTFMNARTCQRAGIFDSGSKEAFMSFSADGAGILTTSWAPGGGWELKFWSLRGVELRDGAPIRLSPSGLNRGPGYVLSGSSSGGALMFVDTLDNSVHVWKQGATKSVRLEGLRHNLSLSRPLFRATFSADGTRAAVVTDTEARVWDARSGKLLMVFPCETDASALLHPLSLSPDGSKLLIAGKDHTARIYPTSPEGFLGVTRRLLGR
jgi:WD40 repeat protein